MSINKKTWWIFKSSYNRHKMMTCLALGEIMNQINSTLALILFSCHQHWIAGIQIIFKSNHFEKTGLHNTFTFNHKPAISNCKVMNSHLIIASWNTRLFTCKHSVITGNSSVFARYFVWLQVTTPCLPTNTQCLPANTQCLPVSPHARPVLTLWMRG